MTQQKKLNKINEFISLFYFKEVPQKKNADPARCHNGCETMCIRFFFLSRDSFHVIFSYKNFDVGTQMVHFLGEALSCFFLSSGIVSLLPNRHFEHQRDEMH